VESTPALFAVNSGTGTPAFTVTMNANHTVGGIFDGPDTPNPCPVTITGTGIMTLQPAIPNYFYLTGNSVANYGALTVNNVIAGGSTAPLYLLGHGYANIYLNGANTYTGGTVLGYATTAFYISVNFNNNSSFGTGSIVISNTAALNCGFVAEGTSAITLANPVVWPANTYNNGMNIVGLPAANGGLTFSGPWTLTSTARLGSYGSGNLVNISGVMSGAGGLNYSVAGSTGLLELTATNTYTGTTTITNGVLQLGDGVAKSGNIAGPITITPPGSLVWANLR
jgi:autotransporter-associated beta strand protein